MSSVHSDNRPTHRVQENQATGNRDPELQSSLPKLWDVQDPFQHAPPAPEGDSWMMLVEPLLRKDKVQCDAWKDEVQNLLIFAGLFSAVVTAFIVESYKTLQEDSSDVIVNLLSQIVSRIDGPLNASASKLDPLSPFAPAASSVRINVFWFISLVLSLTTVLIGIVCLQWLREHQVYSDLSPRQKYAVYNMRADGLKRWHVDKMFTLMPLLLQFALVLFLAGIIDFLHAIGHWAVTIPVAIAISFTLIFLVATTLLPCLQVLSLYIRIPSKNGDRTRHFHPPRQCPYKSPQSQAILSIFHMIRSAFHVRVEPHLRPFLHTVKHRIKHPFTASPSFYPLHWFDAFTRYLDDASYTRCWIDFDVVWLNIRDAYMRCSYNRQLEPYYLLGQQDDEIIPIHDIVAGLRSQIIRKSSAIEAYHCFNEIAAMSDSRCWYRQDAYLHDLVSNRLELCGDLCISDFLFMADLGIFPPEGELYMKLLRQQNIFLFLYDYGYESQVPLLTRHRLELNIRLMRYFQQQDILYTSNSGNHKIPSCISVIPNCYFLISSNCLNAESCPEFSWQIGNLILPMLRQLASDFPFNNALSNVITQDNNLGSFMELISRLSSLNFPSTSTERRPQHLQLANENIFTSILSLLEEQMNNEVEVLSMTTLGSRSASSPGIISYLAALYCDSVYPLNHPCLRPLLCALCKYKECVVDNSLSNPAVEGALRRNYLFTRGPMCRPFSKEWWDDLITRIKQALTHSLVSNSDEREDSSHPE